MNILATLYLVGIIYAGYLIFSGYKLDAKGTIDLSEDGEIEQNKCRRIIL